MFCWWLFFAPMVYITQYLTFSKLPFSLNNQSWSAFCINAYRCTWFVLAIAVFCVIYQGLFRLGHINWLFLSYKELASTCFRVFLCERVFRADSEKWHCWILGSFYVWMRGRTLLKILEEKVSFFEASQMIPPASPTAPQALSLTFSIILRFLARVDGCNWKRKTYQALGGNDKQVLLSLGCCLCPHGREECLLCKVAGSPVLPRSFCQPHSHHSSVNLIVSSTFAGARGIQSTVRCYKDFSRWHGFCCCGGEQTSIRAEME